MAAIRAAAETNRAAAAHRRRTAVMVQVAPVVPAEPAMDREVFQAIRMATPFFVWIRLRLAQHTYFHQLQINHRRSGSLAIPQAAARVRPWLEALSHAIEKATKVLPESARNALAPIKEKIDNFLAPKRLMPPLNLAGREGKLIQHAPDGGIGTKGSVPAGAARQMEAIVRHIYQSARQIRQGKWHQYDDAIFYFNGKHIVVPQTDGTFITVLKNAANNRWFNRARVMINK